MGRAFAAAVVVWAVAASVPAAAPARSGETPISASWNTTATDYRGQNGSQYTFACPAGGAARTVWGSDVYTDDSSVCTAAVHAGVIGFASGGLVTIEIRPGQSSYPATTRNGVTTSSWGSWHGSFVVVGGRAGGTTTTGTTTTGKTTTTKTTTTTTPPAGVVARSWSAHASAYRGNVGQRYSFFCPTGGARYTVWGTVVYTDDSSVCTAAVHAGLISFASGGTVTIEMRPGQRSYVGTTRNGVTTRSYGRWSGSFVFVRR